MIFMKRFTIILIALFMSALLFSCNVKEDNTKKIIVAVLDSGMDLEHEDLVHVLWTNTKEIAGNNKDDDNNDTNK